MAVAVDQMTADDYLATADDRPRRTELIRGTVVMNDPTLPHQRAQLELAYRLRSWIEEADGRGYVGLPGDMRVDDANVFSPDVWWVAEDRHPTADQLYLDGLPDLVVEIRSPSTWARDLGVKLPAYEAAGVAEAWYLDIDASTVLVFRRSAPGVAGFDVRAELNVEEDLTSPLLPGLVLPVGLILER